MCGYDSIPIVLIHSLIINENSCCVFDYFVVVIHVMHEIVITIDVQIEGFWWLLLVINCDWKFKV